MSTIGRGVLTGLAGTVVMTAFQKLVEMPLTGRENSYVPADFSYVPADFAERVRRVQAHSAEARERLNYATHSSPQKWSTQDWVVDVVDKYVQAQSTGLVFDRFLHPARRS
jgi:hypothetical protein